MHFSEDDLAAALRRKDPGPEFTQRVMIAVGGAGQESSLREPDHKPQWWRLRFSSVLAGALAVVLLVACLLGVHLYRDHQAQIARAEKARQEAVLALRITNAKLNHVFRRVNQQEAPQPKIRRQTL
jgi:hypothetical protein